MRDRDLKNLEEAYSQVIEENFLSKALKVGAAVAALNSAQANQPDPDKMNPHEVTQATPAPTPDHTGEANVAFKKIVNAGSLEKQLQVAKDTNIVASIERDPEISKEFVRFLVSNGKKNLVPLKLQKYISEVQMGGI
jgi:hypothetical protein